MILHLFLITAGIVALVGVLLFFHLIRRSIFFSVLGVAAVFFALASVKLLQFSAMGAQKWAPPPTLVTTAKVSEQTWTPTVDVVGSLSAVQGVTLAAEMDGKVTRINFESGAPVKAGDLLVQLDVTSEQAQLRAADAAVELARISLKRSQDLLASHTISQAEFDAADAQDKQAAAQAENIRSVIEKKTIRAPFAGRAGIRLVNLGQILKAGDPVVSLQALDPIYVNFLVPQQSFSDIASGQEIWVQTDALPGRTVKGKVTAINPDVDSVTRNFKVQATLANPDELLRPGMFAEVSVQLSRKDRVLILPATSVLYAPYGNSVFVVEDGKDPATGQPVKTVRQQFVRLGAQRGDFVAVTDGLKAGDEVVTTGVFKLSGGAVVIVNNALSPQFQLAPKPGNS